MKMYATMVDSEWQVVSRPKWFNEDLTLVSDVLLSESGYFVVVDDYPQINKLTHSCIPKDKTEWVLRDGQLHITYDIWERELEDVKQAAIDKINQNFESATQSAASGYPHAEQLTWPVQQKEVAAWCDDPSAETPLLERISAGRGIELSALCELTMAQADQFVKTAGYMIGQRQKFRDWVHAAAAIEDVMLVLKDCNFSSPDAGKPL